MRYDRSQKLYNQSLATLARLESAMSVSSAGLLTPARSLVTDPAEARRLYAGAIAGRNDKRVFQGGRHNG